MVLEGDRCVAARIALFLSLLTLGVTCLRLIRAMAKGSGTLDQARAIGSSPITYELDGRQYVVTSSGGVLFAWAPPKS